MFKKLINEAREVMEAGAVQAASLKLSKARGEMGYAKQDRKIFASGAVGARDKASNRLNKAQRRMGKAMTREPEESK